MLVNNGPKLVDVTKRNIDQMAALNPDAEIVPLTFDSGVSNSVLLSPVDWSVSNKWAASDTLFYAYGLHEHRVEAKRYLLMEYDVFCTQSFQEFYADVWDAEIAALPFHYYHPGIQTWPWFGEDCPQGRFAKRMHDLGAYGDKLCAVAPSIGIMFNHDAFLKVCDTARDPIFYNLFCEARMATAIAMSGCKVSLLRHDFKDFISCLPSPPAMTGPGIWHPVKTVQP